MGISYSAFISVALIGLFGSLSDISTLLVFAFLQNRHFCVGLFQKYVELPTFITVTGSSALLFVLLQIIRYIRGFQVKSTNLDGKSLKPMLFPAKTSHLRLFPKKHGFSYSYLLTGIPIGWTGSSGGMISADEKIDVSPWYRRLFSLQPMGPWYVVDGDSYLERGRVPGGLQGKLKKFLHDQGLDHNDYPYSYLMTSSRFMGYQNNPVSIWNLYSRDTELKAVLLEVNNTFDERHIYFVTPKDKEALKIEAVKGKPPRFTNTWSKEFYVSPFNSRNGSYSVSTSDPFFPSLSGSNPLDLTLTLSSSERSFLVARVFSDGPAIDPSTMSVLEKTRFLLSWWWVGFATFPRTLVQAFKLFYKRSLPLVSRPEPIKVTISRHADSAQKFLEGLFRQFLEHLIETSESPLVLKYRPAGLLDNASEIMYSPSAQISPVLVKEIEISVLTPLFYTHFIKYINTFQALETEYNNGTVSAQNIDHLFTQPKNQDAQQVLRPERAVSSDIQNNPNIFFRIIHSTRINADFGSTSNLLSSFDKYILNKTDRVAISSYKKILLKMWVSDWVALGSVDLLDLQWSLVKIGFFWLTARKLSTSM